MKSLNFVLKEMRMSAKLIFQRLLLLVVFLLAGAVAYSQTPANTGNPQVDKKVKFVIKPNSRDEKVVMRDNQMKRIDKQRQQAIIQKMQQLRQKRLMMMKNDKNRRYEMMQRKKQMMQKRKSIRR